MFTDHIEEKWINSFETIFELCKVGRDTSVIILSETQSRPVNVHLAELAITRTGATFYHLKVPAPRQITSTIFRSTGASLALTGQASAVRALGSTDFIVDLTVEGLMHARELPDILKAGARVLTISNEHPDALERLAPDPELKERIRDAVKRCKSARQMTVTSQAGSDLTVDMGGASTVGVWGWTDRPGTLAHWPGGVVVSFPKSGTVNGRLIFKPGDINLTFKRYFDSEVRCVLEDDFITSIEGDNLDAQLMRRYLASFGDKAAYATSHVGWGANRAARYEALTMYDQRDTNGTELRAVAGNFLYSTGANEFAGRFTEGHFDLPMMNCTIVLDGVNVVEKGELIE